LLLEIVMPNVETIPFVYPYSSKHAHLGHKQSNLVVLVRHKNMILEEIMDLITFITLLGIIITIFFGVRGIKYAYKFRNIPKITYLEQDFFSLFKSIIKNMDGINITYENTPVNPTLLMLKASIVNNGNLDIDSSMVHEPLKIKIPDNCKWKKIKITQMSPSVNINFKMGDVATEFDWDLLKRNEYFSFEALIEIIDHKKESVDIDNEYIKNLSKKICISHRITNLEKANKENLDSIKNSKSLKKLMFPLTLILILAILLLASIFTISADPSVWATHYIIKDSKNNNMEIKYTYLKNNNILIKSIDNKYKEVLSVNEFVKKFKIPIKVVRNKWVGYIMIFFPILIILLSISGIAIYLFIKRKEKYIKALIDIE